MIIETSDNRFYFVRETGRDDLAHVYVGGEVRRDRKTGQWVKKGRWGAYPQLIRKAATRVIDATVEKI